jgi:hypothetical protein
MDGEYQLGTTEWSGPVKLGVFHLDLKARTYRAGVYAPMGSRDGSLRYFKAEEYTGEYTFDARSRMWLASVPTHEAFDPPFDR